MRKNKPNGSQEPFGLFLFGAGFRPPARIGPAAHIKAPGYVPYCRTRVAGRRRNHA